jgi:uncharacterized delta-60 repeat protein
MKRHLLFAALLALATTNAQAQTGGTLDDTFADHGHALADLSAQNRYEEDATKILIQPDGKRVVVVDRYPYIQLIRFNSDGTYDATFGVGGFSQAAPISHFGGPNSNAAIQSDGKIVVAGESRFNSTTLTDFALARWDTNGNLDASFGTQGIVTMDFGYFDDAEMVRVQPDGKLLVAGEVLINNHPFIGLVRYNSDGSVDGTFGVGGRYVNVIDVELTDMGLLSNGKLMVLGDNGANDFVLVRFGANGIIDTGFGIQGSEAYDVTLGSYHPFVRCMTIQSDDKLLIGGSVYNGVNSDMFVTRYGSDGTIDGTFSGDGIQTTHIGGSEDVHDLIVQSDGKIVAGGDVYYGNALPEVFALARYMPNGDLDGTFGVQGTQITSFSGYDGAAAASLALQSDGDITAAGTAFKNLTADVAVATYDVQGAPDQDGYPVQKIVAFYADDGVTEFRASAVQADKKLVAAGYVWNGRDYDMVVARFDTTGVLDPSFGTGGHTNVDFSGVQPGSGDEVAYAVAIQGDGKIVITGQFFGFTIGSALPVARLNSNGTLDGTFGTGGLALFDLPGDFEQGNAIVIQSDSKVVIGGSVDQADFDFALCRLDGAGALDATFGTGGVVTTNFGYQDIIFGLALQPDGKILATGNTSLPNSFNGFDFCTVRYNTDGSVDAGFGTNGRVTTDFGGGIDFATSIALQSDGKVVVGGGGPISNDFQFAIARYTAAGAPDATFGNAGVQTVGFLGYDIGDATVLQSDGKILLAGFSEGGNEDTSPLDIGLARFTSGGVLDATFGTSGKVLSDFGGQEFGFGMNLYKRRIYVTGTRREFRPFTATDKWDGLVAAYFTGPPPPDELINNEINKINLSGLPAGTKQSLDAKLQAALTSLAAGDTAGACNNLNAFINLVKAQYAKKKISAAQATQLISDANAILAALGCATQSLVLNDVNLFETEQRQGLPTKFALEGTRPNPFHGSTQFAYQLPTTCKVSLKIYNVAGRLVGNVVDEVQGPGWKSVQWNASSLPSGVYYYQLRAGTFVEARKVLILK